MKGEFRSRYGTATNAVSNACTRSETASYYQGNLRKGEESAPGKGGVGKNENTTGKEGANPRFLEY